MDASAKYLMNKFSLANLVPYDQKDMYHQFPHNAKTLGKPKQSKPQKISPRDLKRGVWKCEGNLKEGKKGNKKKEHNWKQGKLQRLLLQFPQYF